MVQQLAFFDALLGRQAVPAMLEVGDVGGVVLVVLLEADLFFLQRLGHGAQFGQQLVDPFLLVEEGADEGVSDVDDVGLSDGDQLLDGLIVVLSGKEQSEVGHRDGSEGHGSVGRLRL